jgi:hypothetical protein
MWGSNLKQVEPTKEQEKIKSNQNKRKVQSLDRNVI